MLFSHLRKDPLEGYAKVTLQQVLPPDRAAWTRLNRKGKQQMLPNDHDCTSSDPHERRLCSGYNLAPQYPTGHLANMDGTLI